MKPFKEAPYNFCDNWQWLSIMLNRYHWVAFSWQPLSRQAMTFIDAGLVYISSYVFLWKEEQWCYKMAKKGWKPWVLSMIEWWLTILLLAHSWQIFSDFSCGSSRLLWCWELSLFSWMRPLCTTSLVQSQILSSPKCNEDKTIRQSQIQSSLIQYN